MNARKLFIAPSSIARLRLYCPTAFLLCLVLSTLAHAHNGAVATATPVADITIDGDFSDWPPDMERYAIALPEYGDAPRDDEDLRAFFRVGFNADENALYVAVEVEDESVMPDSTSSDWQNDGCEIYLSFDNESLIQYVIWNNYREAVGIPAHRSGYALALKRSNHTHQYEWRFDLSTIFQSANDTQAKTVLGLDVVVADRDSDDSFSWVAWGKYPLKTNAVDHLGDLWLQGRHEKVGQLRGQLRWAGTEKGIARHALIAKGEGHQWPIETDRSGRFVLDLREGNYEIAAIDSTYAIEEKVVQIRAGEVVDVVFSRAHGPGKPITDLQSSGYWQTLGVLDGLPTMAISAVTQGNDGTMWFGSRSGLSSYNGRHFKTYALGDTLNIGSNKLSVDLSGNIWFVGFEVKKNKQHLFRYDGDTFVSQPLAAGARRLLADHTGNIWLATVSGALRYDGSEFTFFSDEMSSNQAYDIVEDGLGNLWFATRGGLVRYNGREFVVPAGLEDVVDVVRIFADRDNNIWLATNEGVANYNGTELRRFSTEDGLANNDDIQAIHQDAHGTIWIAHYGSGASRFDGSRFTRVIASPDGLAGQWVWDLHTDREGSLWFATNLGVSRYDETHIANYNFDDVLPTLGPISAIAQDRQGRMWLGTLSGQILLLDDEQFTLFNVKNALPTQHRVFHIIEDRAGHTWFATEGGVLRYDGAFFDRYTTEDGLPSDRVETIYEDSKGRVWFGGENGVSYYDGKQIQPFIDLQMRAGEVEYGTGYIYSIIEDAKGHLWFGGGSSFDGNWRSVLVRYDGEKLVDFRGEGQPETITDMLIDRQKKMWVSTGREGISRYDGEQFHPITSRQGLVYNHAYELIEDREGHLWIGTDGAGINRYDGRAMQQLHMEDGLTSNVIWDLFQDRDGYIWIGTDQGLTRYKPGRTPPPVRLTRIAADRDYATDELVRLPSSQRNLSIHFEGISYRTRPGQMLYAYRLKGHDDEWHYTREDHVEYTSLPVGEYTFEVKAIDVDLNYSEQPATAEIEVYYRPMSSSVYVSDIHVQDLFASFYKGYAERPMGSVRVINDDPNPVQATLSFYLPGLMRRPAERQLELEPQSEQRIDLFATLGEELLKIEGTQLVEAEIELSCQVGEQILSVKETQPITVHGRGALSWDELGRAAAFITPEDLSITQFARGLLEEHRHLLESRKVDGDIPLAMLLYEALNIHGIKYAQDASTPYSQARANRAAVDHIQYPTQLLQSRQGDCDDCTVLYCSLLENLNIPTALIDAPGHILMMFDSGIGEERGYGFSLPERYYVERGGRYWIPVEVTKLGEGSFMEAWELGARTCQRLTEAGELGITYVRAAWADYAYALPGDEMQVELPSSARLKDALRDNVLGLRQWRRDYVDRTFITPLLQNPQNRRLQMELAKTRLESEDYNAAITTLMGLLDTPLRSEALYLIGVSYAMQEHFDRAELYIAQAAQAEPQNDSYDRALRFVQRRLRE